MELIEDIAIDGSRVVVRPARELRAFLPPAFEASYDTRVRVADMPVQVALLPFLWTAAPIVWATGAHVAVDVLDERVAASFAAIRDEMRQMYPSLPWSGAVTARSVVETPAPPTRDFDVAALFSGGVDSVWTALRLAGPRMLLISVWGADIALSDERAWGAVAASSAGFAERYAGGWSPVRVNIKALNYARLATLSPEIRSWWPQVQHGMSLAGAAGPVLFQHGIPALHIAASYTAAFNAGWGSTPQVDNRISLAAARVEHDSFELSRQQKVARITALVAERGLPTPQLRVCWSNPLDSSQNCGRCEKCVRTIVGLLVAGADPRQYGFESFRSDDLAALPAAFSAGRFRFTEDEVFMWSDLQAHAATAGLGGAPWDWLRGFDFERYRLQQPRRGVPGAARLRSAAARAPRAYDLLRRGKRLVRQLATRR
jgi:hypothetical protein